MCGTLHRAELRGGVPDGNGKVLTTMGGQVRLGSERRPYEIPKLIHYGQLPLRIDDAGEDREPPADRQARVWRSVFKPWPGRAKVADPPPE